MIRFLNWLCGFGREEQELIKHLDKLYKDYDVRISPRGGMTKIKKKKERKPGSISEEHTMDIVEKNGERYLDLGDGNYALIIDEDDAAEFYREDPKEVEKH